MGQTVIRFGDPKAVKIWSGRLFTETDKQSYFNKFEGTSENSIIQRKTDLESASGDRISFDLSVKLRGKPTAGDARVKGKEEQLKFFTRNIQRHTSSPILSQLLEEKGLWIMKT